VGVRTTVAGRCGRAAQQLGVRTPNPYKSSWLLGAPVGGKELSSKEGISIMTPS
jgi:hypothetical protein